MIGQVVELASDMHLSLLFMSKLNINEIIHL